MGLTSQQALLNLEGYTYYEVYNIKQDTRYGFCAHEDKIEFEKKHPNKLIFKKLDFNYDDFLYPSRLKIVMELDNVKNLIQENLDLQEKYPERKQELQLGLKSLRDLESEMMEALNLGKKDDSLYLEGLNKMSEIEIILSEQIDSDLGSRNKIEELYQNIPNDVSKVVMNFTGVKFMGRSFAQEYLNQKNKANFEVIEINMPKDVEEMFKIILKINGHL